MRLKILIALTSLSAGRAMTLAWVTRAGDGGVGDPPSVWLMPLLGDTLVGLAAIAVAYLLWRRATFRTWLTATIWTSIAAFDALAAYLVEVSAPWPEFFMLEIFGRSMFFAAAGLHFVILYLLMQGEVRRHFGDANARPKSSERAQVPRTSG